MSPTGLPHELRTNCLQAAGLENGDNISRNFLACKPADTAAATLFPPVAIRRRPIAAWRVPAGALTMDIYSRLQGYPPGTILVLFASSWNTLHSTLGVHSSSLNFTVDFCSKARRYLPATPWTRFLWFELLKRQRRPEQEPELIVCHSPRTSGATPLHEWLSHLSTTSPSWPGRLQAAGQRFLAAANVSSEHSEGVVCARCALIFSPEFL